MKKETIQMTPGVDELTIEMGSGVAVILDKLFGPLIFANLKIVNDIASCQWIIYRQNIETGEWIEKARIEGQEDSEFDDTEET